MGINSDEIGRSLKKSGLYQKYYSKPSPNGWLNFILGSSSSLLGSASLFFGFGFYYFGGAFGGSNSEMFKIMGGSLLAASIGFFTFALVEFIFSGINFSKALENYKEIIKKERLISLRVSPSENGISILCLSRY